jgi:hypothetical protein
LKRQQNTPSEAHDPSTIRAWFAGRLPEEWTSAGAPTIEIDREEITVTLEIALPVLADDASDSDQAEAAAGRISGFREDTRERRMGVADEAEQRFGRTVSWAVTVGGRTELFTHVAAPVMTRLRQPERQVLDTLIDGNIARSRAEAVAWCVRLVGKNTDQWLTDLRAAISGVDEVRHAGPDAD